jgi:general stress protein YciG
MKDKGREIVLSFLKKIGSKGGKSRAAKHDKATLRRWGKKGGRPRKGKEAKCNLRKPSIESL